MVYRGFKLLFRDSRFNALNLASLDALDANANANVLAVDGGANRLQVRAEGALIANMSVRYGEKGLRSLAAHCATSCHNGLPIITIDLQVCAFDAPQLNARQNTQLLNYTTSPSQSQICG